MRVSIEISSVLHKSIPPVKKNLGGDSWDLSDATKVSDLLEKLNLPETGTVLVLNGRQCSRQHVLKEGDRLKIFPMASGG